MRINTAAVSSSASQIDAINKEIRSDMSNVDTAIKNLQKNWEGSGSSACNTRYKSIKSTFKEARFSVINNLVSFLKEHVGVTYEDTEQKVSNAASKFK